MWQSIPGLSEHDAVELVKIAVDIDGLAEVVYVLFVDCDDNCWELLDKTVVCGVPADDAGILE